ncbi:hypothetical protein ABBQ38_011191 [Trebouxia sp. C0009 RCD-2024]
MFKLRCILLKTLQDRKLCFGADSLVVLQMLTGQTKLVKVHTHVVEPTSNNMFQTVNRRDVGMYVQRTITVLLVVYVFDVMADTFRPRLDMPKDLPMQIHNARKALQLIEQGQQLSGFNFGSAATVVSMCVPSLLIFHIPLGCLHLQ